MTEGAAAKPRVLKSPQYRSFRLQKRIRGGSLPSAFRLLWQALTVFVKHWRLFLTVVIIYTLLNVVLVQGLQFAVGGVSEIKAALDSIFSGNWSQLANSLAIFALLLGSVGSVSNTAAGIYQVMLTLVVSLAMIWLLRQVYAGHKVRARDGFYLGMAPLVPFILVLAVIALQLVPFIVGVTLYTTAVSSGLAATLMEQVMWGVLVFLLGLLSLYMVTSSLFALYVVTLPGMTPIRALRAARKLVAHRRWAVMRKAIFLPIAQIVIAAVIIVPLILFVTPAAAWVFLALTMFLIPITHSYLYALYRAML